MEAFALEEVAQRILGQLVELLFLDYFREAAFYEPLGFQLQVRARVHLSKKEDAHTVAGVQLFLKEVTACLDYILQAKHVGC